MFGRKKKDDENSQEDVFKIGGETEELVDTEELVELEEKQEEKQEEKDIAKEDKTEEVSSDIDLESELEEIDLEDTLDKPKKKGFFSRLFSRKKKDDENSQEDQLGDKKENEIDSNIFDDFDVNSELGEEVKSIQKEINKDSFHYLILIGTVVKYINLILIFLGLIAVSYIYVQNDETLENSPILDPICSIILDDNIDKDTSLCSSLSYIGKQKIDELSKLEKETFKKEIGMLARVYKKENFLNSKEVIFLLEKGESRLRPLKIISLFDDLKNEFEPLLKSKISCSDLKIDKDSVLTASCYAYSTGWEGGGILGFKGDINSDKNVAGTSISLASSFLNFLEKQDSELSLLEKQKIFSIESVVDPSSAYTKRTPFSIKMKYSPKSDLYY